MLLNISVSQGSLFGKALGAESRYYERSPGSHRLYYEVLLDLEGLSYGPSIGAEWLLSGNPLTNTEV